MEVRSVGSNEGIGKTKVCRWSRFLQFCSGKSQKSILTFQKVDLDNSDSDLTKKEPSAETEKEQKFIDCAKSRRKYLAALDLYYFYSVTRARQIHTFSKFITKDAMPMAIHARDGCERPSKCVDVLLGHAKMMPK